MTKLFENAMKSIGADVKGKEPKIPSAYDMTLKDTEGLMKLAMEDPFYAVHYAFMFGFVMGNRATITRKLKRL